MVNIRKRGKVYQYQFEIAKVEGKRKYISKSGFKTKNEALMAGMKAYNNYINGEEDAANYFGYIKGNPAGDIQIPRVLTFESKNSRKHIYTIEEIQRIIRRFILHILPPRFMKIRYFGLLGNRNKTKKLTLCKSLTNTKVLTKENISPLEILKKVSGKDFNLCPICKIGHL